MVLTSFLHKILFTFTAVDRTSLNPGGLEARMLANAIGVDIYVATIFGYVFSLLNLVFKQFVKDHYFDSKYPTKKWY